MPRHALAPLFEPHSLLVVADEGLPAASAAGVALPPRLLESTTNVPCPPGEAPRIPDRLNGVAAGARPDLAIVRVAHGALAETLRQMSGAAAALPLPPRALVVLADAQRDPDPAGTAAMCRAWARQHRCALLGPHTFGLQRPAQGLNLSGHPTLARRGRVAVVAQSRSIAGAMLDWAEDAHIGFSTVVTWNDAGTVRVSDVLDYLATDAGTDSVAIHVEDPGPAREFVSALRALAMAKPVVVLKTGREDDDVFDAVLRRAGAVRVRQFLQLFSAVKVLGYGRRPRGRRVAVVANGRGPAQLVLDMAGPGAVIERAELGAATVQAVRTEFEAGGNPAISAGPIDAATLRAIVPALLDDPGVDGVLVLLAPDPLADLAAVTQELVQLAPRARKPLIPCLMGDAGMRVLRRLLDEVGTPAFRTPESAVEAFGLLAAHYYNQQLLQQTPAPLPAEGRPDLSHARDLVGRTIEQHLEASEAAASGRPRLGATEAWELLAAFRVPIHPSASHRIGASTAEPLSLRVDRDGHYGPVIRLGPGGRAAAYHAADGAVDLPPLNAFLARQLMARSRFWSSVLAPRAAAGADETLQQALVAIAELIAELPEVEQLRIDPLYVDDRGLHAEAPEIVLAAARVPQADHLGGYPHMTIHPYPSRLVQERRFADGQPWTLRPIRPEDAEALQSFTRGLSEHSRYMRFISMMRELTPRMLARYTQVDYDREVALVAVTDVPDPAHRGHPREEVIGVARYLRNADGRGAEFALVIGDDWQRRGLGRQLMRALVEAAREQRLEYIDGLVLAVNTPMLALMKGLGFRIDPDPEDPTLRRVWLPLPADPAAPSTSATPP
jgi:acetyltransferase